MGGPPEDTELQQLDGWGDRPPLPGPELYRLVVENSGDLIVLIDREARIKFASPSFETVLGYGLDEVMDLPGLTLVHPDDLEAAQAALAEAVATGQAFLSRIRVRRKDGVFVQMEAAGTAVRDQHGEPELILAVVRDVGARAVAEAAERRLGAQYGVARVLAEADSLAEAAPGIVQAVCETLGWDLGAIWRVDQEAGLLRCVEAWHAEDVKAPRFEEATRNRTFGSGEGLPGRAWATGQAAWIRDVVADANFPRAPIAEEEGIHGAFAFPILLGTQTLGVLEFFSREVRDPDEELLRMMTATGSQIGQFIQRREAEADLSELFGRERAAREEADMLSTRFRRLQAITDAVAGHLSLDDLLRELLDAVRATLQTDTATVLLVSEDGKHLAVRAVSGDEEEPVGQVRVPIGKGIAGRVASRREAVIVDDVPHAGPHSEFLRKNVKSLVAVPLEAGGQVIGVMHGATFDHRTFTQEDLQLLRLVGERSAVAMENFRLYEAEQAARMAAEQAMNRTLRLQLVTAALSATLSPAEVAGVVVDEGAAALGAVAGLMALLSEDGGSLEIVRDFGYPRDSLEPWRVMPLDTNLPVAEAVRTGLPVLAETKPGRDSGYPAAQEIWPQSDHTVAAIPMLFEGRAVGGFVFRFESPRRLSEEDIEFILALAGQSAQAVERARLYEAERRARAENERLYQSEQEARRVAQRAAARTLVLQAMTASLSEAVTSADVADVVIDRGLPVLGARAGSVVLLQRDGTTLRVVRQLGYPEDVLERWGSFSIDEAVPIAEAVRTGEPVFLGTRRELERRFPKVAAQTTESDQAWAAVPMTVEGAVVGAIGISFAEAPELEEEETGFLLALARQCGQALERTRLYDSEQQAHREAEAARSRLLFLTEASDVFSASLDPDIVLESLTRLVTPDLADWCLVDLLEGNGTIRQTAVSHVNPSLEPVARELRLRYPPDPDPPHSVWKVLMTGEPELAPEITEEDLRGRAKDEMHLKLLTELGIRSHMVVPIKARGRTLGAVSFVSTARRYGPDDLVLAEEVVARAALAVDNARLYQQQRHVARALQESLLPPSPPQIPGMELAARYHATGEGTEVGGDFYDVFEASHGAWAVVIGDVCGKGPEAAAVTGLARYTIRATAMHEDRPSVVLDELNQAILQQVADGRFCTVCYARVRPNETGARVTVCSGGHPLPLVLRAGGALETAGRPGRLLGVFPETELSDHVVDLFPGDSIILYTDGVTEEAPHGVQLGVEKLGAAIRAAAGQDANGIADAIVQTVFGSRVEARDDVAAIVLRIPPRDAGS